MADGDLVPHAQTPESGDWGNGLERHVFVVTFSTRDLSLRHALEVGSVEV
jgi:hypothetical protein